jgi:hypothetical protein
MSLLDRILAFSLLSSTFLLTAGTAAYAQQANSEAPNSDSTPAVLPDAPAPNGQGALAARQASDAGGTALGEPLTFHERLKLHAHSYIEAENYIGPALGAGIGQWEDSPSEWGEGAGGYGERYASGLARSAIARTISFGVAASDGEDSRYFPLREGGIWRRTRHAAVETFVSRGRSGGSMPAVSRFAGVYSAGFIANAWEPPSQRDAAHAMERGSTALLSGVGWRLFEEFWPDLRHRLHPGGAAR